MGRVSEKITTFLPWAEIEPEAQKQILNTAELPFIFKWVAVMPDCHYGKGATVGTVIATKGAVVPAAVGVDIGCGMIALETSLGRGDLQELHRLREGIERRIPMSAGRNNSRICGYGPAAHRRTEEDRVRDRRRVIAISTKTGKRRWARSAAAITSPRFASTRTRPSGSRCIPDRAAWAIASAITIFAAPRRFAASAISPCPTATWPT